MKRRALTTCFSVLGVASSGDGCARSAPGTQNKSRTAARETNFLAEERTGAAAYHGRVGYDFPMKRLIASLPVVLILCATGALLLHGPITQAASYHDFADRRTALGLPNAADVISNAGFALAGLWGLARLWSARREGAIAAGWNGHCLFLVALLLTAAGSTFYHLAPDNARLFWDRLPIALACGGLVAGVYPELHPRASGRLWAALMAIAAVLSVLWWSYTDSRGQGDLRPYLFLQAAPLVLIPLWQAIHRAPRADRTAYAAAILLYAAAKVAEIYDREIYSALGWISGHTAKHLLAAAASGVLVLRLVRRAQRAQTTSR